jgi:predicted O-methyltransferase YrrM
MEVRAVRGARSTTEQDDAAFSQLVDNIRGTPWMLPHQGRRVWDHVRRAHPQLILDIGTCYGTSAAYMAAACRANGSGRVVTLDSGQFDESGEVTGWCQELWRRCGVDELIDMIRIPHSNYAWWLMQQVAERSSGGVCEPVYDFVYLDGAKWLTLDTAAVVYVEQLLRPSGWLLMDDLDWTYEQHPDLTPVVSYPKTGTIYNLSDTETTVPHLRAVFDLTVKHHPSFSQFLEQDGQWGWAQKLPDVPRRATIEVSVARPPLVDQLGSLRHAVSKRLRLAGLRRQPARRPSPHCPP